MSKKTQTPKAPVPSKSAGKVKAPVKKADPVPSKSAGKVPAKNYPAKVQTH